MEAIILAGGKGTRLQSIITEVPKPMAPIGDKPFLFYLLKKLYKEGVTKIILSVGYKQESIINYFGNSFENVPIVYSTEKELLGTGGAIAQSLEYCNEENVFIINGDTYIELNYSQMFQFHREKQAHISMCLKEMKHYSRYGTVHIDTNLRVIGFEEKKFQEQGLINAGVYCIQKRLKEYFPTQTKFSFETDFLEKQYSNFKVFGYVSNSYFIDIGIPEDYQKAIHDFTNSEIYSNKE